MVVLMAYAIEERQRPLYSCIDDLFLLKANALPVLGSIGYLPCL